MKATGIVRRVDQLGRIIIPKDIRKELCIKEGDAFDVFIDTENNGVLFIPYEFRISDWVNKTMNLLDDKVINENSGDKFKQVYYHLNEALKELKGE